MIHLIERFTDTLKKGRYNSQTIVAYRNAIYLFYNEYRDLHQSKIDEELISDYLKRLAEKKGGNQDVVIQTGKALKLFFETIFDKKLNIKASGEIKNSLPEIFSQDEVIEFLQSIKKIKPKTIFYLIYACGLSLSELINLKVEHLDFENHRLNIVDIKDKTASRELRLPPVMITIFKQYFLQYKPKEFVFANESGKAITPRSVQISFQQILSKTNIKKEASVHTLRHSYAVHLLQKGIDIHYLQEMMGHKYLQTTAMYNQYVDLKIVDIESPIEFLVF